MAPGPFEDFLRDGWPLSGEEDGSTGRQGKDAVFQRALLSILHSEPEWPTCNKAIPEADVLSELKKKDWAADLKGKSVKPAMRTRGKKQGRRVLDVKTVERKRLKAIISEINERILELHTAIEDCPLFLFHANDARLRGHYYVFMIADRRIAGRAFSVRQRHRGNLQAKAIRHTLAKVIRNSRTTTQDDLKIANLLVPSIPQISSDEIDPAITIEGSGRRLGPGLLHGGRGTHGGDAPPLPANFLQRGRLFAKAKEKVLSEIDASVAITGIASRVGLEGMGGIGKSVLASAIARDPEVKQRYCDGVYWLSLGTTPNLTALQIQLAESVGTLDFHCDTISQGKAGLSRVLGGKTCLVVLDDVWDVSHLEAFDIPSPARLLITTRNHGIITNTGAERITVDVLNDREALELLARWSGHDIVTLPPEAEAVAKECGNLPLAIAMVGAMVKDSLVTWANVLSKLQHADLEKIARQFPNYPYPSLLKAIQVSVDSLDPNTRHVYLDFAVFPEDAFIPIQTLVTFFGRHSLSAHDVEDILQRFVDLSLAGRDAAGRFYLHDLQHDYVTKQRPDITRLHSAFIDAYAVRFGKRLPKPTDDDYFFARRIYHLCHAGREPKAKSLMRDYSWIDTKLRVSGVKALIQDFNYLAMDSAYVPIRDALRRCAHILAMDTCQLPSQLLGRLLGFNQAAVKSLVQSIDRHVRFAYFRPVGPSLTGASDQLAFTLDGHKSYVTCVALMDSARKAISCGEYDSVRVWDLETGGQINAFGECITRIDVSPNGRFIAAACDDTIQVWLSDGQNLVHTLLGHEMKVTDVKFTSNSALLVSCSEDCTIRTWDLRTGKQRAVLKGHEDEVNAICVLHAQPIAISGSADCTLRVWDLETVSLQQVLSGHEREVNCVAAMPGDDEVVSGSWDHSVRVWNLKRGTSRTILHGHCQSVKAVCSTPDGRYILSGSADTTVNVWEAKSGCLKATLRGHHGDIRSIAASSRPPLAISASADHTLKVWRLDSLTKAAVSSVHEGWIYKVCFTTDNQCVLSVGSDSVIGVWDRHTGNIRTIMRGHEHEIEDIDVVPGTEYAVSCSVDRTIRVWDWNSGKCVRTLCDEHCPASLVKVLPDKRHILTNSVNHSVVLREIASGAVILSMKEHTNKITDIGLVPDKHCVVSGSKDGTTRLWNFQTGKEVVVLGVYSHGVSRVAISPNGKYVVSCFEDGHIRIWELAKGREVASLAGHERAVTAVLWTLDGKCLISGGADDSIRIWESRTWKEIRVLDVHKDHITSLQVLGSSDYFISSSWDNSLRAWSLRDGTCVATFTANGQLSACAASSDSKYIALGERFGHVHILAVNNLARGSAPSRRNTK